MKRFILSIVTVVFNDAKNLKKTSDSINALRDYFKDETIEHIIWDGNSTDETKYIVKEYFPYSIYKRGSDSGIYDAMNKGSSFARGKYLFYLNAGDEVLLTSKSEMNSFLKILESGRSDIFTFNTVHCAVNCDGNVTNWLSIANNNIELICFGMLFSHQGCVISKKIFDEFGGYTAEFRIAGDWHFFNRLYLNSNTFEKLNVTFAKTLPFGVSSDLLERTFERYNIVSSLYSNSNKLEAIKEMYSLFFAVMHNDNLPPIKIAEQLLKAASFSSREIISAIKTAKKIYQNRIINGGVKVYGTNMWDLPNGFNKLTCHDDMSNLHDLNSLRLIFLISLPRSGSTLFQRLLEGSSQIASSGEPWVCLPILSMFNNDILEHKCDEKLILLAHKALSKELNLPNDFYKQGIKAYLSSLYDKILLNTKKRYYLDKTPRYVHIINEIKAYFPDSKFIILTRNPLEIINSYASTWAKNDFRNVFNNPYFTYDFKNGFAQLVNFIQKHKDDKNVFCIDYSDIVEQRPGTLLKLNAFLGTQDITFEIKHEAKAKSRLLGDPKNINKTDKIIKNSSDSPQNIASRMKNQEYLIKILNLIPKNVFDYFDVNKEDLLPSSLSAKRAIKNNTVIASNKTKLVPLPLSGNGEKGKIGIGITTFNDAQRIEKTLQSVASQLHMPDSIVISDDCSTDNTIEVIKEFMAKFPDLPIKLIQHSINIGVSKNRDQALKALETDYVTHLDGDDLISPLKLQKELSAIELFQADVAFSDIKVAFENSSTIQNTRFYHKRRKKELVLSLINRSYPVPRDLMMRKDVYLRSGGFSATINLFEDWHHKQRLAWHSRDQGWVHSGCVGTTYNRTEPGLSKRSNTRLLIAQLRVLAMNYDIIENIVLSKGVINIEHLLKLGSTVNLPHLRCLQGKNFKSTDFMYLLRKVQLCAQLIPIEKSSDTAVLNKLNELLA